MATYSTETGMDCRQRTARPAYDRNPQRALSSKRRPHNRCLTANATIILPTSPTLKREARFAMIRLSNRPCPNVRISPRARPFQAKLQQNHANARTRLRTEKRSLKSATNLRVRSLYIATRIVWPQSVGSGPRLAQLQASILFRQLRSAQHLFQRRDSFAGLVEAVDIKRFHPLGYRRPADLRRWGLVKRQLPKLR